MANAPAAELLWQEIERTKAYREGHGADSRLAPAMKLLNAWQAERLARTYADLRVDPRYKPATEFFLSDLYGPKDFTERGFRAYRHMNGAKEFLDAVETRETRILERIYARDPKPFRLDRR